MSFQETLDFLYSQLPVFHRIGASAYKKDLMRTIALLEHLGNPHHRFKSIHIAGTNGKGSSSHMLASILQEAGYKTGLYTSPHIKHFGERIKIDGQFIDEAFVIQFVQDIKHLLPQIEPSFFELTVAMAFYYFAENHIDIAVIETGLGGKLDSTNIVTPIVSLITNISYDHMDLLGDTLTEIATEKAGIIKHLVPVIISECQEEVSPVFVAMALENDSPVSFASDYFQVKKKGYRLGKMRCRVTESKGDNFEITSSLVGNYQLKNLAGVLKTVEELKKNGLDISNKAIQDGIENVLENTGLKGRWQTISQHPLVVCDIAHNEAGIQSVLETAQSFKPTRLHIVMGMVKDKDANKVLKLLPKDAAYYLTNAHIPRALPAIELQGKALEWDLKGEVFDDVNLALEQAKSQASVTDLILVCGSNFLIAEVNEV
jgi:dihydrofolate synthase / folylpolyglutamate synthase